MADVQPERWTERLSVGHPVLDEHHRRLFDLTAHAARLGGEPIESDVVRGLVDELLRYTAYHFAEEERLMAESGFPFLDLHRDSHRGIVMRIEDLAAADDPRPPAAIMGEIALFLSGWLVHHIEIEDFEYKPFVASPKTPA